MQAKGYAYSEPNGAFSPLEYDVTPGADEAVVRVAGCGLCHTDISFWSGDVPPRHATPLVLGHEISGVVEAAGANFERLKGKRVIVPAVMPCGDCELCRAGYEPMCKRQFMPGNDGQGGFADLIKVPAKYLCELPDDLKGYELADLSVIADAVTTPYQSVVRSGLKDGEVAVVIGVGGIGTYGVQIAKAFGAKVAAIDIDDAKLARISDYGADFTINCRGKDLKAVKEELKTALKGAKLPSFGWKIFEMSGTKPGQELAFGLIPPAGTLAVVGFTMAKLEVRLSNLMAFDARCFGNWGCTPDHYPAVVKLVLEGKVNLKPFIRKHPLSQIGALFEAAHHGKLAERAILTP